MAGVVPAFNKSQMADAEKLKAMDAVGFDAGGREVRTGGYAASEGNASLRLPGGGQEHDVTVG